MPEPNCKSCKHYDDGFGGALTPRCKLALERIEKKLREGTATLDEIDYYIRKGDFNPDWICEKYEKKKIELTNGDFVRSLSNDELAVTINFACNCCVFEHPFCIEQEVHCCNGIRQWLNRPYEGHCLSNVYKEILKEAKEGIVFKEDKNES